MVFSQQKALQARWLLGKFCFKKVSAGDRIQLTLSVFRSRVASGLVSTLMGDIQGYRPGSHKKPPWKKVNYFHIFLLGKLHRVVQIVAKNKAQFKWDFYLFIEGKGKYIVRSSIKMCYIFLLYNNPTYPSQDSFWTPVPHELCIEMMQYLL